MDHLNSLLAASNSFCSPVSMQIVFAAVLADACLVCDVIDADAHARSLTFDVPSDARARPGRLASRGRAMYAYERRGL